MKCYDYDYIGKKIGKQFMALQNCWNGYSVFGLRLLGIIQRTCRVVDLISIKGKKKHEFD